jgi:hypothetical protein
MQNNELTKVDQNHQGIVQAPNVLSEKNRFGAPDGPRRHRNEKYDGQSPLEYPGHEAVANFLALPKSIRQFRSVKDLAKHFHVTRMTINRWGHDPDVIQRAHFLSEINQMAGDLLARQEWPRIMQTAVQRAIEGDLQSIKFCESRAYPKELRVEQPHISATVSIQDLLGTTESDNAEELPDKNRQAEGCDR